MRLIILMGWPGVGKTAVGRALSMRTGFHLLDNQLTYEPVVHYLKKGSWPAHQLNAQLREAILGMLFRSSAPGVIVTSSIRQQPVTDSTKRIVRMASRLGWRVDFVHLLCAWEEHKRRIKHPSRRGHPKTTTIRELLEKMASPHFRGLPGYPPMVVDISNLSPGRCASRLIRALGLLSR